MPVTDDQRALLIQEARRWLAWSDEPADPSGGVGHSGLPEGEPGLGGDQGGVGRAGLDANDHSPATGKAAARAFAERILRILGEPG
jgi:hypothetical protein